MSMTLAVGGRVEGRMMHCGEPGWWLAGWIGAQPPLLICLLLSVIYRTERRSGSCLEGTLTNGTLYVLRDKLGLLSAYIVPRANNCRQLGLSLSLKVHPLVAGRHIGSCRRQRSVPPQPPSYTHLTILYDNTTTTPRRSSRITPTQSAIAPGP